MSQHPGKPQESRRHGRGARFLLGLALVAFVQLPSSEAALAAAKAQTNSADDLLIVDCQLPQKVRRLGRNNSYLAPRKCIRTTAADCRIRGGEYTEPDQVTYATSLKVWLPDAEGGEAEAQFYVGQIFEKGLGTAPDYTQAASWYRKAADQGYAAAAVSLGYLYEEGLGVAKDEVQALNWYRSAAGLAEDLVVLEADDYQALIEAKKNLEQKSLELDLLKDQIEDLRRQLGTAENASEEGQKRQAALKALVERLEQDLVERQKQIEAGQTQIARLEKSANQGGVKTVNAASASLGDIRFGTYHALVIGNSNYKNLPKLESAAAEAREVAELLKQKYGFKVQLLEDASRFDILNSLNSYRQSLTQKDNLLVFYAGHSQRGQGEQNAFWQPVDADPVRSTQWIPSGVLTEHLDLIAANHVFVVANSVFAGLRTRSSVARLPQAMTEEQRYYHIKLLMEKRARLVLSSGGESAASGGFTAAFVEALKQNEGVLEASSVYQRVNDKLFREKGNSSNVEFAAMKWARNDLADFFFVPAALR